VIFLFLSTISTSDKTSDENCIKTEWSELSATAGEPQFKARVVNKVQDLNRCIEASRPKDAY
jgi:hypothetical protein